MLRRNIFLLVLAALLCLGMSNAALAAPPPGPAVISVSGRGSVDVAPDMATVNIGIVTTGKTAQLAQAENARIASDVTAALGKLGIFSKDIQTHYTMSPVYEKGDYRKVAGYRASNTVTVTVNDVDKTGKVIDTALSSGATDVNGLSFGLKDVKSVRNSALQMAVQDARSKADAIAGALGVNIIGIQNVKEGGGNFARYEMANARLARMDGAVAADTPVSAGTVEVEADVNIDFQIQ
ncbi:SIMPL domain-containing protein [Anaerovibrio sp.]|uniref:SIMPL domain-containing protein n=1 Tax=Anaerovibrio sp. TaxID=1872532 RepID=UPI003F13EA74